MSQLQKDDNDEWESKEQQEYDDDHDDYDSGFLGWLERTSERRDVRLSLDGLALLSNLIDAADTGAEVKYYWFFAGQTIGSIAIDSFMIVNNWTNWFDLTPMPQYERFNPNHIPQEVADELITEKDLKV